MSIHYPAELNVRTQRSPGICLVSPLLQSTGNVGMCSLLCHVMSPAHSRQVMEVSFSPCDNASYLDKLSLCYICESTTLYNVWT